MTSKKESLLFSFQEIGYIIFRNTFILTNGITLSVAVLLYMFGDVNAGIFLSSVMFLNITMALLQDIRAWYTLKRLQLLTAPHVLRVEKNGSEEVISTDEVRKGDTLKIKIGDQIPCDSIILQSRNLEINEGLITGESDSISRKDGEKLLAGSIATSGSAVIEVETVFHESRIARMTEGIKKYSTNISPIQHSVSLSIKYFGYVLVLVISYILIRGFIVDEPYLRMVKNIGTLSSTLVPQGLVFAITLFFAYGAAHLFGRNVLLQEVNATEKLGRIKNLCMDKTGTLTENMLSVERMLVPQDQSEEHAKALALAYIQGSEDSSQTINAIKKYIPSAKSIEIIDGLPFSSWRQYGAAHIKDDGKDMILIAGASDILLPYLKDTKEQEWLQSFIDTDGKEGKRILCVMSLPGSVYPEKLHEKNLSLVTIFVFNNHLREGIADSINFFQQRGVTIRIISGDNPETVRTVAAASGVKNTDRVITGKELTNWSQADYDARVKEYTIFARIVPEQKEKIISAFKKDGFTAMVGDGANDALAIKKADLGIAMFDGAPATRQLASVVLTNNSFSALPHGVELADTIIRNIEIFSSMFLSQTFLGLFFFIGVSVLGHEYPLTPLNVTLINYFTIGIPNVLIAYWTLRPAIKSYPVSTEPFLKRILPFAVTSAALQAITCLCIYLISPDYLKAAESNTLIIISYSILGILFFFLTPSVYRSTTSGWEKIHFFWLVVSELILFYLLYIFSWSRIFFDITVLDRTSLPIFHITIIFVVFAFLQYLVAQWFISKKAHKLV